MRLVYLDAPSPWGIYFQDSATPVMWFRNLLVRVFLSNSRDSLKFLVPCHYWKIMSRWAYLLATVISQEIAETIIGYRGSKSIVLPEWNTVVKEQRVYGNLHGFRTPCIRYTLTDFERNYQVKILSNQIINKARWYSSIPISNNRKQDLTLDPWFLSGFTGGEGCFTFSISRRKDFKLGWNVQLWFEIALHNKDLKLLELVKATLGVGNIYPQGKDYWQFKVGSIEQSQVVINLLDLYPLITQKQADYQLWRESGRAAREASGAPWSDIGRPRKFLR